MAHRDDDQAAETNSPACAAHKADPSYMGCFGEEELIAFLNELLEAETAGARVTLATAHADGPAPIMELMLDIHHDEARWCAMLLRHIKARGGTPSSKVGGFYEKAMAIADVGERLAFLNRGQGWVVRKLRDAVARVHGEDLRCDLAAMLRSHEDNIGRANNIMQDNARD